MKPISPQLAKLGVTPDAFCGGRPPPDQDCTIETRRGTEVVSVPIPCAPGAEEPRGADGRDWPGPRILP